MLRGPEEASQWREKQLTSKERPASSDLKAREVKVETEIRQVKREVSKRVPVPGPLRDPTILNMRYPCSLRTGVFLVG